MDDLQCHANNKNTELRRRTYRNGTKVLARQCLTCGRITETPPRRGSLSEYQYNALPEYDENLASDFYKAEIERRQADYTNQKSEQNAKFWDWYNEYLASQKWKFKRSAVMARSNSLCEACLSRKATEVHHTTYEHVGDEPLWELRAVCHECHELITSMDREKKEAWK